jgi:hypothetical protein
MSSQRDQATVPTPDPASYYGRPVLKPPVWKVPDVPAYLYLGGMAGACSVMASCAGLTGRPRLARAGRLAAATGATTSVAALMHDLGRPKRFLNMLRVFKPTSPLSVGSWILAPFSALSGAAAIGELTGWRPWPIRLGTVAAAVLGPAMTTYTAVLLSDTAVPGWHEPYRELPFIFTGSAMASAGAVSMTVVPVTEAKPARRMAVAGSALELVADYHRQRHAGIVGEVYRQGRPGRVLRVSRALTWLGAGTAILGGRSRAAAIAAGVLLTASAAATRYGIFEAGRESARDPRYTVRAQRQRPQRNKVEGLSTGHSA